jgi:hypothetical protein
VVVKEHRGYGVSEEEKEIEVIRGGRVGEKGRGKEDRCGCRSVKVEDDEVVYRL